ncbi:DUF2917 domain-containing protein [Aromatoleum diolicum]|uniref:DUF2917 domain-containing protein n=1 Tax=Aromatoleum diolicum TaxID=75796 RepID=A0ABX1QEW2_9RHOO|nr:DUF2917 domain-containing protein [Aromatoleum diolicum]NMG75610.1 DUF2917 domain-containing protein [Aromatoleum diolicum]
MDARSEITRMVLAPRETMVLDQALGVEVIACKGSVWLTQDGDSRDIVLNPSQSFTLSHASGVVMTTSHGAEFILRSTQRTATTALQTGWMRRLVGWFDPRTSSRVCAALAGRVRVHRVA